MIGTAAAITAAGGAARVIPGLQPLVLADAICAPAATCACSPGDNLALHRLLQQAAPGSALVVDAGSRVDCGYFGELAALDAAQRGHRGLVIGGSIRDGAAIGSLGFPVFAAGFAPAACVKRRVGSVGASVVIGGVEIAPGDQMVADRDAVLVVAGADWPGVEAAASEIVEREEELRVQLARGCRLADLLELPMEEPR